MGDIELTTARLSLTRPTAADVDAILAINGDPRGTVHNPSDLLADRADAEHAFALWDDHWRRHGFGYWTVRERSTGVVVGFCGLDVLTVEGRRSLNLFYRVAPDRWGGGIGAEAATAVLDWAVTRPERDPVIARIRPENRAAQRTAVAAGLVRAPHLDGPGYDGVNWAFSSAVAPAPAPAVPAPPDRVPPVR